MSQFTHTYTATTTKGLFPHLHTHTNTHKHTLALVARLLSFSASMSHSPSINIPTDKALANHSLCAAYQPSLMGIYSACLCVCAEGVRGRSFWISLAQYGHTVCLLENLIFSEGNMSQQFLSFT